MWRRGAGLGCKSGRKTDMLASCFVDKGARKGKDHWANYGGEMEVGLPSPPTRDQQMSGPRSGKPRRTRDNSAEGLRLDNRMGPEVGEGPNK